MRINYKLLLLFFILPHAMFSRTFAAAPFSNYGNIQNVQNYSSNPFWTPDAPYNQRMPTPVYVNTNTVGTSDCQTITANLIEQQCATQNNCATTRLSDIRPALMMQLTNIPGANYGTACAGYLDAAFNDYVKKNANAGANTAGATFPTPTLPTQNTAFPQPTMVATFPQPTQPSQPDWASEEQQRKNELEALRAASGKKVGLDPTNSAFPTTYEDLSFTERMANAKEGYEPFKDSSAYKTIKIESEEAYITRQIKRAALRRQWCEEKYNTNTQTLMEDLQKLKKCRAEGKPIGDCETKGLY
ncbi:MAG: hypothetical protein II208_01680 [Alphaproteobacteria bacterium]|nr:hypothetical protein [Alphaproteobacteria bacterium]